MLKNFKKPLRIFLFFMIAIAIIVALLFAIFLVYFIFEVDGEAVVDGICDVIKYCFEGLITKLGEIIDRILSILLKVVEKLVELVILTNIALVTLTASSLLIVINSLTKQFNSHKRGNKITSVKLAYILLGLTVALLTLYFVTITSDINYILVLLLVMENIVVLTFLSFIVVDLIIVINKAKIDTSSNEHESEKLSNKSNVEEGDEKSGGVNNGVLEFVDVANDIQAAENNNSGDVLAQPSNLNIDSEIQLPNDNNDSSVHVDVVNGNLEIDEIETSANDSVIDELQIKDKRLVEDINDQTENGSIVVFSQNEVTVNSQKENDDELSTIEQEIKEITNLVKNDNENSDDELVGIEDGLSDNK